jgi:hypothetical protein
METEPPPAPGSPERINVMLTADASEALARVQQQSGVKKVDLVNRAIQVFAFLDAELRAGGRVTVRDANGAEQRVVFF